MTRDIGAFILLLAVLGAIVFLAYTKTIDGQATIALITSIVSLAAGALAVHTGIRAGKKP